MSEDKDKVDEARGEEEQLGAVGGAVGGDMSGAVEGAVGGEGSSRSSSVDYGCLTGVTDNEVLVIDALSLRSMLPRGQSFGSSKWILGEGHIADDPEDAMYYLIDSDLQYVRPISESIQAVLSEENQKSLRKKFLRNGSLVFSESTTSSRSVSLIGLDNMVSAEEDARQVQELQAIWDDVMGLGPLPDEIIAGARAETEADEGAVGGVIDGAEVEVGEGVGKDKTMCEQEVEKDPWLQEECPICLQVFQGNFAILSCQHRFCQDCVDRQLVIKRTRLRRSQLHSAGEYAVPIRCALCRHLCTTSEIEYVVDYEELFGSARDDFEAERRERLEQLAEDDDQPRRIIITDYSDLQGYYDEAFMANDQAILDVLENGTVVRVGDDVVFYASTGEIITPSDAEAARAAEIAAMNIPRLPLPNVLMIPRSRLSRGNQATGATAVSETIVSPSELTPNVGQARLRVGRSVSNSQRGRGRGARQPGRAGRASTGRGPRNMAGQSPTGASRGERNQSASRRASTTGRSAGAASSSRGRGQRGRSAARSSSQGRGRGRANGRGRVYRNREDNEEIERQRQRINEEFLDLAPLLIDGMRGTDRAFAERFLRPLTRGGRSNTIHEMGPRGFYDPQFEGVGLDSTLRFYASSFSLATMRAGNTLVYGQPPIWKPAGIEGGMISSEFDTRHRAAYQLIKEFVNEATRNMSTRWRRDAGPPALMPRLSTTRESFWDCLLRGTSYRKSRSMLKILDDLMRHFAVSLVLQEMGVRIPISPRGTIRGDFPTWEPGWAQGDDSNATFFQDRLKERLHEVRELAWRILQRMCACDRIFHPGLFDLAGPYDPIEESGAGDDLRYLDEED